MADPTLANLDWSAKPIGPSQNLKLGEPIAFDGTNRVEAAGPHATLCLDQTLDVGFPQSFGWIIVEPAEATLRVNGEAVAFGEVEGRPGVAHVWEPLRAGANRLELRVPTGVPLRIATQFSDGGREVAAPRWSPGSGRLVRLDATRSGPLLDRPRRSVELRRVLPAQDVQRATLTLIGPALRETMINGRRVGSDLFEPGWTDYRRRLVRCEHDVTALLDGGEIDWRITLANGWFTGGLGPQRRGRFADAVTPLWVAAELTLHHADNLTTTHATDELWQWRPSATHFDTLYDGETRGLVADHWQAVAVLPSPDVAVGERLGPPVRALESIEPVTVRRLPGGDVLYDFGRNHSGVCHVPVAKLPAGTRLQLQHAEVLDADGELATRFLRTARATDQIMLDGETNWTPRFTYHGYQFVQLTGLPPDAEPPRIVSRMVGADVADAGSFRCQDDRLNAIDTAVRRTIQANLHSVITDCPQRDERLGWTGDVTIIADTAPLYFDLHGIYRKTLRDLIDAQEPDGAVPFIVPNTVVRGTSMAWSDLITVLPLALWDQYADRDALREAWPAAKRWLGFVERHTNAAGRCGLTSFGDWVPIEPTPEAVVVQAWASWTARLGGRIARLLNHTDDARRFDAQADARAAAFHALFFDAQARRYAPDTQTAQLLPLAFDLVPPAHVADVRAALVDNVEARGKKPTVGFLGAPHLLPQLAAANRADLALGLLTTSEPPSLGYMLAQGATTIWERWDSDTAPPDMNSRNHFAFGSLARWLHEDYSGLRHCRDDSGADRVRLSPSPCVGDLDITITRATPAGRLTVCQTRAADVGGLRGDVPDGVDVELHLPNHDLLFEHNLTPIGRGKWRAAGTFNAQFKLRP
jgi:alpha-L-rhamnosidase